MKEKCPFNNNKTTKIVGHVEITIGVQLGEALDG